VGGGQHFQSLPKSRPSHVRGRNEAWGPIPPRDWRARELTGSDFWLFISSRGVSYPSSLPARANQEAGLVPTPRYYGRGRDLDVILEVIGSVTASHLYLRV